MTRKRKGMRTARLPEIDPQETKCVRGAEPMANLNDNEEAGK